jgi:hypothetical protein
MDNQHKKIKGYRDLSQAEIDLMNEIKAKGEELRALVSKIHSIVATPLPLLEAGDNAAEMVVGTALHSLETEGDSPTYWLRTADSYFRSGLMAAVRAVAQPTSY